MFKIKIDQLKIRAKIGASKKERNHKQLKNLARAQPTALEQREGLLF